MFDRLRRLMDSPLGAILGGAFYGSWATFANWSAGVHAAARIGFIHFLMSTGLTLAGVAIMNRLYHLARRPRNGAIIAFCGSMACTYTLLIGVHSLIGTPHILLTLAPGFIPTVSFCVVYPLLLLRHARQNQGTHRDDAMEVDHEVASVIR
ncbi:hypothetical protein [Solimonas terrae]|uniref:Uncharacterized protein n=1 Tax=Solimonas terrae TaxID=1396819 RepID=A0A6M2BS73_9GAMM|nr:hypothetical protein [Solimonas terrae]NGY05456.1 hypothetical protein [Solimonas terrae]